MQILIDTLKKPLGKAKIVELAGFIVEDRFSVKDLIDLSFNIDDRIGFRSAWILENVFSNHQDKFLPYSKYFLDHFSSQTNLSALRHYVKILAFMTKKNACTEIATIIKNYDTDNIVEIVFAWLIDEKIPVAVKSHCLNILANLNFKHNWIKDELLQTMEFLVDKESIAFFGKVRQIRKQYSVGNY